MCICVELFLLINFIMNLMLLSIVCRGYWFRMRSRIVTAALIGALYALLETAANLHIAIRLPAICVTFIIAFPLRDKAAFIRALFMTACLSMCVSVVMRAVITWTNAAVWGIPFGAAVGGIFCLALASRLRFRRVSASVLMRVNIGRDAREFTALVDTGNLLIEPLSALPVLIVDERALGRRISRLLRLQPIECEIVYTSVGGNGGMRCARPDKLEVYSGKRWRRAPDMWLGLYQGCMHSGVHALAPVTVLQTINVKNFNREAYS